jgi:hypothetical protein
MPTITIQNNINGNDINTLINNNYSTSETNLVDIKRGAYDLDIDFVRAKLKSNINYIGQDRYLTTLINGGITKNDVQATENIQIKNLTINVNNKPNRNAINLNNFAKNVVIDNITCRNTANNFLLHFGKCDGLVVTNSEFVDAGTADGKDNCAGGQIIANENWTIWKDNYFLKTQKSKGGGLLTTGQTGNIKVERNYFDNPYGVAYAGFSCESQEGNSKHVVVESNLFINTGVNFGTNNLSHRIEKAELIDNRFFDSKEVEKIKRGGIISHRVNDLIIDNNYLEKSNYGIFVNNCNYVNIANNDIYETNSKESPLIDRAGIYCVNSDNIVINNNKIFNYKNKIRYGIYIRANQNAQVTITNDNQLFNFIGMATCNQLKEAIKIVNPLPVDNIQGTYTLNISQEMIDKYSIIIPQFVTLNLI